MISSEEKEKKTRFCVMPPCAGERFNLVHKFPREEDRMQEWLKAVDLPHLYDVSYAKLHSSYFICSRHFRRIDYKNALSRHLNKTAVPCLNLKALDRMDEVVDTRVGNPVPVSCTVQTTDQRRHSQLVEEDNLEVHPVKYRKNNAGNRLDATVEVVETCDPEELPDDVEKFIIMDEKQLADHPTMEYCRLSLEDYHEHEKETEEEGKKDGETVDEQDDAEESVIVYQQDEAKRSPSADIIVTNDDPNSDIQEEAVLQIPASEKEFEMSVDLLEINHPGYKGKLQLDNIWLRDHCRCSECYNSETHQRKFNILDIPLDVKPLETEVQDEKLGIKWSDGHESHYDFDFLYKAQSDNASTTSLCQPVFWDQDSVHQLDYSRVNFNTFLTDDQVAKSVVKSLVEFGFAFIEKVPPNTNMTEAAIKRLFPIQKTFFGDMWTFSDEKDHSDTAYTKDYLGSHTDNTYWNDAAGLQVLHCIKHSGSGGETFLVDGFKILHDFELKDPKAYNRLSTINVPAEYIESGTHYKYTAPIIRLDPITRRPEQIRYNVYDRAVFNTIPQSEMQNFYRDFRSLAEEVNQEVNQWRFKLNPGTVMIFDNWRVLHGRERYTGKRQITGCYVARCEFLNVARVMGLIS